MELEEQKLKEFMEVNLISFKEMIDEAKETPENPEIIIHQDAFAADYQEEEFILLGKSIKYVGLQGVNVRIIGTNRTTLKNEE